jgi:hypothetical protein
MTNWYMLPLVFLRVGMVTLGIELAARYYYWWGNVRNERGEDGRLNPLAILILCAGLFGMGLAALGGAVLVYGSESQPPVGALWLGAASFMLNAASILALVCRSLILGVSTTDIGYRFVLRTMFALLAAGVVLYARS